MGKKTKVGKQRKDKYYSLAKEAGYRSRAAFKLIQLNRKFEFLQKSRVCIDLCAAPGGWMQIAKQNMPVSSIVIGVDLYPIKPIQGCISLTEDITTDKCRTAITRELQNWKADVVLHDGAPNVGKNWLHDAYQQVCLTLSAVKLATSFLRGGGWFITKVFRSKDYHALIWVLKQLFKKVHATKPQASRNESAEIFVVCQYYIAPDKIDPKLLNPKYVFEELEIEPENKLNVYHPEKQKKGKAEGYPTNDYTLYHELPVSEFIRHPTGIEILQKASQIMFDSKEIKNHPKTTTEIKECCKDIKVLGRKDLRLLLNWKKELYDELKQKEEEAETNKNEVGTQITEIDTEKLNDEEIDKEIATLKEEELRELKRKRKRANKERSKLLKRMNLKMVLKNDEGPTMDADNMFALKQLTTKKQLNTVVEQSPEIVAESDEDDDDEKIKPRYVKYQKEEGHLDSSGLFYKDSDSELEMETDEDSEPEEGLGLQDSEMSEDDTPATNEDESKTHPLITDLDYRNKKQKKAHKAELWFERDVFKNLITEQDEDRDLNRVIENYKKQGVTVLGETESEETDDKINKNNKKKINDNDDDDTNTDSDSDSDSASDSDYDYEAAMKTNVKSDEKDGFEIVKKQDSTIPKNKRSLSDTELAMGAMMVNSKRAKRELIDNAWNRYTFNDTHLPDWFAEDEKKFMKRNLPVPKELVEEYKKRRDDLNVRTLKKVVEAKGRKKRRAKRKMEKTKKKVEALLENDTVDDRDRTRQIKQLYKKAQAEPKKKITYVVAKKHLVSGRRFNRPKNLKGRFKVVDPRQKKDIKGQKRAENRRKGTKRGKR